MPWKLTSNHGWKFSYLHFITIYKYIFCWCVLKKQKCPSCTATGSLALDTGFFTPRAVYVALREGMRSPGIKSETEPTIPFSYMQSCGREFRTSLPYQLLPQASWIVNSISRIGRETSRAPKFYWIVVSECKWNQWPSPEIWCHFFKAT